MRYLPLARLEPGMVLGQSLCGKTFEALLRAGVVLSPQHIRHIGSLGYAGVYIDDELSREVEVRALQSLDLWTSTAKAAGELLQHVKVGSAGRRLPTVPRARQENIILPVIDAVIKASPRMLDIYDLKPSENYDSFHATGVAVLALFIGVELGLTGPQLFELGMASLLHDVGNAFIPRHILEKPGKLTEAEYAVVQSHSGLGFHVLRDHYDISIEACMGALQHHENYNGTGYPNQLAGERISIYGRIIAVADVYDALVSRRPYRDAMLPAQAIDMVQSNAGSLYDPQVVQLLARIVARYPVGTLVQLNTGAQCMVVQNYPDHMERPRLRLLNGMSDTLAYIDLCRDSLYKNAYITAVL